MKLTKNKLKMMSLIQITVGRKKMKVTSLARMMRKRESQTIFLTLHLMKMKKKRTTKSNTVLNRQQPMTGRAAIMCLKTRVLNPS